MKKTIVAYIGAVLVAIVAMISLRVTWAAQASYPNATPFSFSRINEWKFAGSVTRQSSELTHQLSPTAVTLDSFNAEQTADGVLVRWQTVAEGNSWGFYVLRRAYDEGTLARINPTLIPATGAGSIYEYLDTAVVDGVNSGVVYEYWLQEVERDGNVIMYGPTLIEIDAVKTNFLPFIVKQEPPTPVPTEAPPLTPTPTPTLSPGVVVLSSNVLVPYTGSTTFSIIGEVLNSTSSNVESIRINITLRDAVGNVVDSGSSYSYIGILTPGMTSPFAVGLSDSPPWATYEWNVTWYTTTSVPSTLEVLNTQSYFDSSDRYHVVGEIRNQYSESRNFIRAVVTIYDAQGKVIGADYTYTNPDNLNPGQTASFDAVVYSWMYMPDRSKIAGHLLQVVDDWDLSRNH
jgi:hypothetical protein